jgi:hypothetical protein
MSKRNAPTISSAYLLHPMRNNFSAVLIAAVRDQSTQIRRDSLRFSFSNGI